MVGWLVRLFPLGLKSTSTPSDLGYNFFSSKVTWVLTQWLIWCLPRISRVNFPEPFLLQTTTILQSQIISPYDFILKINSFPQSIENVHNSVFSLHSLKNYVSVEEWGGGSGSRNFISNTLAALVKLKVLSRQRSFGRGRFGLQLNCWSLINVLSIN